MPELMSLVAPGTPSYEAPLLPPEHPFQGAQFAPFPDDISFLY
jgi:hypothetical protein